MNRWLMNAPRWALVLFFGAPFGIAMGVMAGLRQGEWTEGLTAGVTSALIYGPIMGVFQHRQLARYREATGGVPRKDIRRAMREARRGRTPQDPAARAAALRLVALKTDQLRRQRRWGLPVLALLAALCLYAAISLGISSGWLGVLMVGVVLVMHVIAPIQLRRRTEALQKA